jgi:hypothetical protein
MLCVLMGWTPTVLASSNVTAKFDGDYAGVAEAMPDTDKPECRSFAIGNVTITKGFIHTPTVPGQSLVSGFITEQGYVTGRLKRPDHQAGAMDGRLVEGVIVAGFIEDETGCVWIVRLKPGVRDAPSP